MLMYCAYRGILGLTAVLPRGLQYGLARRLAEAAWLVDRRSRRAVQANLRVILGPDAPEADVRRQGRQAFRSFGMYLCEFFGAAGCGEQFLRQHVRVVGRENLDRALSAGRGALFVSGHYSNWEMGAFVVGRLGYPILIVAEMHRDPRVNALFVKQRAAHGVTVVPTVHGARAALRALRENRPVAILGDRPTGGPGVTVELCGRPAQFPRGPWRLALQTGAPLLPTFMCRQPARDYTLEIGAPLAVPARGTRAERMAALAQAFAGALEARLRADPAQSAAFHSIWGPEPAGLAAARPAPEPCGAAQAEARA